MNIQKQHAQVKALQEYFERQPEVVLAFLFGSRSKEEKYQHWGSDWDVGVYLKPYEYMEIETEKEYPAEKGMWGDLVNVCQSNDVDLVVLNRARPSLVYNVLRTGLPLAMKNRKLYFDLLCKVSYEAMDWWQFVDEYYNIREKTQSLTPEAKEKVNERLVFLEEQFRDIQRFKNLNWPQYREDKNERRNVERWVENLVMSALDIAKIVLASDKKEIPQSYQDTLKLFYALYIDKADEATAEKFSEFAKLRNIVVHEYLDIKWKRIQNFIKEAEKLYAVFIEKTKQIIES